MTHVVTASNASDLVKLNHHLKLGLVSKADAKRKLLKMQTQHPREFTLGIGLCTGSFALFCMAPHTSRSHTPPCTAATCGEATSHSRTTHTGINKRLKPMELGTRMEQFILNETMDRLGWDHSSLVRNPLLQSQLLHRQLGATPGG